jgi:hypothetical protein
LALAPAALAHHGRISGGMDCAGTVTFTASAWQTSSVLARTHNDVRVYVVRVNDVPVPSQQVGSGQFNLANGFSFSGSFSVPSTTSSVKLLVKEIGSWANGVPSSGGTNDESDITVTRPKTGCAPPPPPDECPNIAGAQASIPAGMSKDASGNCVTPPPPPTDQCPNLEGLQTSVPTGMVKDATGACSTPPPPPTDECANLAGVQTSVPAGMLKDSSGNCSTPPPPPPPPSDECPNIEGIQTSVPAGMARDASGTCAMPPSALVTATPTSVATPVAKTTPKVKAKVKKATTKKVVKKKKVVKRKKAVKKKALKKQSTAAKTKPRALPFTP